MNTTINNLKAEINLKYAEISTLEEQIEFLRKDIRELKNREDILVKEELRKLDFIEGLAEYIRYNEFPLEFYKTEGIDSGKSNYVFGKASIKVCWNYGYTDIIGLTDEEFETLKGMFYEVE